MEWYITACRSVVATQANFWQYCRLQQLELMALHDLPSPESPASYTDMLTLIGKFDNNTHHLDVLAYMVSIGEIRLEDPKFLICHLGNLPAHCLRLVSTFLLQPPARDPITKVKTEQRPVYEHMPNEELAEPIENWNNVDAEGIARIGRVSYGIMSAIRKDIGDWDSTAFEEMGFSQATLILMYLQANTIDLALQAKQPLSYTSTIQRLSLPYLPINPEFQFLVDEVLSGAKPLASNSHLPRELCSFESTDVAEPSGT